MTLAISLADDSKMPNHQLWINKMMITDENIPKAASEAKSAGDTARHPRRASQTGSRLAEAHFGGLEGSDCQDLSIQPKRLNKTLREFSPGDMPVNACAWLRGARMLDVTERRPFVFQTLAPRSPSRAACGCPAASRPPQPALQCSADLVAERRGLAAV